MSIADKLLYLNETKTQLRQAINAVYGAGLTEADPFRSYTDPLWEHFMLNTIFGGGKQGAWYDPSDLTTLFQDAAGTTPVTADGDPVGLMLDKSGNGNHASQAISAARPTYRTDGTLHWIEGDGIDDHLVHTAALTQASTVMAVAERLAGGGAEVQGLFTVTPPNNAIKSNLVIKAQNSENWGTFAGSRVNSGISLLGNRAVVSLTASGGPVSSNVQTLYTNGVFSAEFTGGYGGDLRSRMHILAEAAERPAYAKFFGGIAVDNVLPSSARYAAEQYLATKAGVTL